ncbi:MAG TPA: aldehyde ferredoxin oxidoreductase family protein [Bacillota bacterium]|nr:aldehyde ferredoxin oxidoreductase family protein [Bacillota bacterium]
MYGNTGKIAELNLSTGELSVLELDEDVYKQYIGGAGLAAKLLFDRGNLEAEPLSEESMLIIAAGPLTGTGMAGASRFTVAGRSPQTGIWGQASCGGYFGHEMKCCGFDALILTGKAKEPVYLLLGDGKIDILPAADLWGKDTYETTDILKERYDKRHRVLAVGPAAENGVVYACIMNDKAHSAGRTGMGTVLASKNVKALVARGSGKIQIKDPEAFKALAQSYREQVKESILCQALGSMGTAANMEAKMFEGDVPSRNWGLGVWEEGAEKLSGIAMMDTILTGSHTCYGCPVGCKRVVKVEEGPYQMEEGPGPEYETLAGFGTLIMNSSIEAASKANEICNRLGMDTISCAATIAWAMDCFEQGILKAEDFDGLELKWGDIDTVIKLLYDIAANRGKLGQLLAKGSRAAAREVGGGSEKYLTDTKGLEAPMHDPRCYFGLGLNYAVSVRGACHVSNLALWVEWGACEYPEIGVDKNYVGQSVEYKSDMCVKSTDLGCITNSACWCQFPGSALTITQWVELFNAVAGYDYDIESLMAAGARIFYLQRCLNHIWGATAQDDRLGERIMTPVDEGMIAGVVPDMDTLLKEFYEMRGLGEDGRPSRAVLEQYGLAEVADRLGV